jgi:methyl-accepting chemotaxis protein
MNRALRLSLKILAAAASIVAVAFALFTRYNDYLQRNAIHQNLENYLHDMGSTTAAARD